MLMTDFQSQYIALELRQRVADSDSSRRVVQAVAGAQVDVNPHQVMAALFAFRSPLNRGVLLADEVGLGKTIEAGLVIAQRWAERKRRILIVTPAHLRMQWSQELAEKFFIQSIILEGKSFNAAVSEGTTNPFECQTPARIVICSYQFAAAKAKEVQNVVWDLVVMDEAHRLRNVYKSPAQSKTARTLRKALSSSYKLLLTATPLQNSLLELFGLASMLDEHIFGDLKSFREQYASLDRKQVVNNLKNRIEPFCHRTLRRQVSQYISYTNRIPLLRPYTPDRQEQVLYELVSEYLRRENLQALPSSQRTLMTLVLRKLLASSSFAIAGALKTLTKGLEARLTSKDSASSLEEQLRTQYEPLTNTQDEWDADTTPETLTPAAREAIEAEIHDLQVFHELATSIQANAKGAELLSSLGVAFQEAEKHGAAKKAVIFTESTKTQQYLLTILENSAYRDGIVLFNGTNNDARSRAIYESWKERNKDSDRFTGSRSADIRTALVDYFREEGQILIATEAGAEGINLQFCSLVINYDLPWNPQRIEQRIGRCHRYGQKHDVVVVNFLNNENEADKYVMTLLDEKFQLFKGVFGSSDEVLGSIENGVDFERRIAEIYQQCRHPDEIKAAFEQLQAALSHEISDAMTKTRHLLLEHFDDEVREKLKHCAGDAKSALDLHKQRLMSLTRYELRDHAVFPWDEHPSSFVLQTLPPDIKPSEAQTGLYELPRQSGNGHIWHQNHPLAEHIIFQSLERTLTPHLLEFSLSSHSGRITALEAPGNHMGWLALREITFNSKVQDEDCLLLAALNAEGEPLETELIERLLFLPSEVIQPVVPPSDILAQLDALFSRQLDQQRQRIEARNSNFFSSEISKLENWADDCKVSLELEIKELDRQLKEAKRASTVGQNLQEKLSAQKLVRDLEKTRSERRKALFTTQDEIDLKRGDLIQECEAMLKQTEQLGKHFLVQWRLV